MYVNTNVAALNAWQNLYQTQQSLTQVLQQLSSGNRINTAANDPAGLAISQQMQTQIDGMQQANQDSQAGISLLQTADGALGQIQNILQSMRSLASEAATATENPTDLQDLQTEMNQYASEITSITNNTQFNNVNLLSGSYVNENIQVGSNQGQSLSISLSAADAFTLGVTGEGVTSSNLTDGSTLTNGSTYMGATGLSVGTYTLEGANQAWNMTGVQGGVWNNGGTTVSLFTTVTGNYSGNYVDTLTLSFNSGTFTYTDNSHVNTVLTTFGYNGSTVTGAISLDGVTFVVNGTTPASGTTTLVMTLNPAENAATLTGQGTTITVNDVAGPVTLGEQFQITGTSQAFSFDAGSGYTSISTNNLVTYSLSVGGSTLATSLASGSGLSTLTANLTITSSGGTAASAYTNGTGNATAPVGIDISSQANAAAAMTVIDNAINTLSNERANVGAYQNRLQFASSDLQTSGQNLQAAQAGITQADMAMDIASLTRYQILQQSGVSMLSQADAIPQALLKLLP